MWRRSHATRACCWTPATGSQICARSTCFRTPHTSKAWVYSSDESARARRRTAATSGADMPYFALFYETVDDYVARRGQFRAAHLDRAREAYARGELLLAGALADPVD